MQHVTISSRHIAASIGQTWINLVDRVTHRGTPMGEEGLELLATTVVFQASSQSDEVLEAFGDRQMIAEMQKVFFCESANSLGHSYAKLICGPGGRHDLQDVISLLKAEPPSKRALVNFSNQGGMKVPCINAVQFLVRDGALQVMYFARGQDVFRKFYADALCLGGMAERVAGGLELPTGVVRGFIGSSHVYQRDMPAIRETLLRGSQYLQTSVQGALA